MHEFDFVPKLPRRTHCAPGSAGNLAAFLPAVTGPVLLVSDRGLARLGLPDGLRAVLERSGRKVSLFTDLAGEPTLADLNACVSQAEADGVGAVVGLGGGSALDTAKAVAALLGTGLKAEEAVGADRIAGRATPLVLIPTTAGTGSEATPNALFLDQRRRKAALISPHLLPDVALLDPTLTAGLPPAVTASTGLDALTHAVESYLSRRANPVSRAFSAEAVRL
ncbi:MAG TPA: iron-containing alcohol dehydrogenase, partial [Firmicutes bacterium]|nr:iron-containing alcohol dehydrogenase [Bacillota bacterium]